MSAATEHVALASSRLDTRQSFCKCSLGGSGRTRANRSIFILTVLWGIVAERNKGNRFLFEAEGLNAFLSEKRRAGWGGGTTAAGEDDLGNASNLGAGEDHGENRFLATSKAPVRRLLLVTTEEAEEEEEEEVVVVVVPAEGSCKCARTYGHVVAATCEY
jgi:hypothetical protein